MPCSVTIKRFKNIHNLFVGFLWSKNIINESQTVIIRQVTSFFHFWEVIIEVMEEKLGGEPELDKKFLYFLLQMHKYLIGYNLSVMRISTKDFLNFLLILVVLNYIHFYILLKIYITNKKIDPSKVIYHFLSNLLELIINIENRRNSLQNLYQYLFLFKVFIFPLDFYFYYIELFLFFNCTFIYLLGIYLYKFPFQNIRFIILPLYMKYTFVAGLFGLACAATAAPSPVPLTLTPNKKIPNGVLSSTNTKLELNADKILGSNIASSKISSLENTSTVKGGTSGSSSSTKTTVTTLNSSGSGGFSGSASSGGFGSLAGGSSILSSNLNQFGNNEGYQSSYSKSGNLFDNIGGYQFDQYNYSPSNSYNYDRNYNSARVINQAQKSLVTPNRSLDSLFLRFPSCSQLDRLILSADAAAILKTIQTIATDSSVPCHQRLTYLSQLLGRLKTAVEKKVYNANQLKIVIDSSLIQIQKLTNELQLHKKYVNNLGIPELRERQAKAIAQLQDAYANLNNFEGTTPVIQAKIKGYQRQIDLLGKNSDKERSRIDSDKLRFIDISNQVANLEARLKQLNDKKVKINGNIVRGQNTVKDNQVNINKLRADAESIQLQLKNIRDSSDKVNYDVRDLEVKVERYRTDASVAEVKRDRYLKQITELNDKINAEKKKLVDDDLISLSEMIDNLRNLLRTVEKTIDQRYFRCYGAGDGVRIEQSGDTVIYVVNGESFADYLKEHYGQSIQTPSIRANNVSLNRVNIFGTDWTGQYGYPFMDKQFDTVDFSINGSFNCLNEGELITGSGVISDIGSNYIEAVGDDGENRRFSLGSCSRLESTLKVPKKGQKFYWKGARGGQGYNLFGGSCIE